MDSRPSGLRGLGGFNSSPPYLQISPYRQGGFYYLSFGFTVQGSESLLVPKSPAAFRCSGGTHIARPQKLSVNVRKAGAEADALP